MKINHQDSWFYGVSKDNAVKSHLKKLIVHGYLKRITLKWKMKMAKGDWNYSRSSQNILLKAKHFL